MGSRPNEDQIPTAKAPKPITTPSVPSGQRAVQLKGPVATDRLDTDPQQGADQQQVDRNLKPQPCRTGCERTKAQLATPAAPPTPRQCRRTPLRVMSTAALVSVTSSV
jgi:hypothetical protein